MSGSETLHCELVVSTQAATASAEQLLSQTGGSAELLQDASHLHHHVVPGLHKQLRSLHRELFVSCDHSGCKC